MLLPAHRPADWPQRLRTFIASRQSEPFAWGRNDCATFAAAWVRALHGVDLLGELQIRYTDAAGAALLMRDNGGLRGLAIKALGAPRHHATLAQRGDVVRVLIDGRESLAVLDAAAIVGPGLPGLAVLPLDWDAVLDAWMI